MRALRAFGVFLLVLASTAGLTGATFLVLSPWVGSLSQMLGACGSAVVVAVMSALIGGFIVDSVEPSTIPPKMTRADRKQVREESSRIERERIIAALEREVGLDRN